MATRYTPKEKAIPFSSTVDITSHASTNAGYKLIDAAPCYHSVWAAFELTCTVKDVTITITPDTTGGNISSTVVNMTAGKSYTVWVLLKGTYPGLAVTNGSHTFTATIQSTVPDQHGTVAGYYTLHGLRPS